MISKSKHPLGKILVALKYAKVEQVKAGLALAKESPNVRLGQAMQQLGYCTDVQIARALSKQQGVLFVDLSDTSKVPPEMLSLVTAEQVKEFEVVPVLRRGNTITVASCNVLEYYTLDNLRFIFGCEVNWCITPAKHLANLVKEIYGIDDFLEEDQEEIKDPKKASMDFQKAHA